MKNTVKRNLKYVLGLLLMCGLIPHVVLAVIAGKAGSVNVSPVRLEAYSMFITREWIPFWAVFLCYLRRQKTDRFSPVPVLAMGLILCTFIPKCGLQTWKAMVLVLPLMLIMECFTLLKKLDGSASGILTGMAANREMLAAFFFWTVAIPGVAQISCAWTNGIVVPVLLMPVPAALLVSTYRKLKGNAPTMGGILGILLMLPMTYFLTTTGPMENFQMYNLLIFLSGYVLFFLFHGIYHMDRWLPLRSEN